MTKISCSVFLVLFIFLLSGPISALDKSSHILENITFEKKENKGETVHFKLNGSLMPKMF